MTGLLLPQALNLYFSTKLLSLGATRPRLPQHERISSALPSPEPRGREKGGGWAVCTEHRGHLSAEQVWGDFDSGDQNVM